MSARVPARAGVVVEATLDNLTSRDVRFLQEAARRGALHVRVPSDALVSQLTGAPPKFPAAERLFLARAIRCVATARVVERPLVAALPALARRFDAVVVREGADVPARAGLAIHVVPDADLAGFPDWVEGDLVGPAAGDPPRAIVTGCYDWLHSGHIRFFMDAAAVGELFVVVGSDHNVALLKGAGHPLQTEQERRYMVGAIRQVHRCLVSTGSGWMDAAPEVDRIRPAFYVVNEDGDQSSKREFCAERGIGYVVLERKPHKGLPTRSSTALRGF